MKITFIAFLSFTTSLVSFAQTNYEPQILVLSPNKVTWDKIFEKEISDYNLIITKSIASAPQEKELNSKEMENQPANIKRMIKSELAYSKNMTLFKQASSISEQMLAYKFIEKFPNLLIELSTLVSEGSLEELNGIAEKAKLQYVLNFPKIIFYKSNNISFAKLTVQLYDYSSNSLFIDTSFIGNWTNPGFEYSCENGSLGCTINNAISQALEDVFYHISMNSPTLKKERKLRQDRSEAIKNNYYNQPFDKSFISNVIPQKDSNINLDNLYQTLISDDNTKFVAFFLDKVKPQNLKQLSENKEDNNVNIINNKSIKDTGYLDNIPQTYAYIVKAVKYLNKWYYQKSNVTYFEAHDNENGKLQYLNNLEEWNFFQENSIVRNPAFWETNLFSKIKDLRKDPDWKKYGKTMWKTEEEENRDYIGLYELVAEQLKIKKQFQIKRITVN